MLIKVAQTNHGKICLGLVCDGMGGLSNGELASATVIRAFERWFEHDFPEILKRGFSPDELKKHWYNIILEQNQILSTYAAHRGVRMGTTIVALLLIDNFYYIMNVGDSRVYLLNDQMYQLTKDQSLVQCEVDAGRITPEEAERHPQRNVLLQCVGASDVVNPDFYEGLAAPNSVFILCSDGFRHIITSQEIYDHLNPSVLVNEQVMQKNAVWLTELNKQRREVDNISVAVIKICQEE